MVYKRNGVIAQRAAEIFNTYIKNLFATIPSEHKKTLGHSKKTIVPKPSFLSDESRDQKEINIYLYEESRRNKRAAVARVSHERDKKSPLPEKFTSEDEEYHE